MHLLSTCAVYELWALTATAEDVKHLAIGLGALGRLAHPCLFRCRPFADALASLVVELEAWFTLFHISTLAGARVIVQDAAFAARIDVFTAFTGAG